MIGLGIEQWPALQPASQVVHPLDRWSGRRPDRRQRLTAVALTLMVHLLAIGCIVLLHVQAPQPLRERPPIVVELITPPVPPPTQVARPVPVAPVPPPVAPRPAPVQPQVQAAVPAMPAPPRVEAQPPPPGPPPSYALPAAPLAVAPAADAVPRPSAPSGVVAAPPPAPVQAAAPKPVPVAPPSFDADYLHNPTPRYPAAAQRLRESGKVLLSVSVTASGMPERVEIAASSGSPRLDQAALDTVRRWRFVPARQGDQAVAATVTVPLVFRLDE